MRRLVVACGLAAIASACGSSGVRTLPMGEVCSPDATDVVCADGLCLALDSASGFCTRNCTDDCPEGFRCEAAGRFGRVCRAPTGCKTEVDCPAGHQCNAQTGNCYIAVSRSLCGPCQDVTQCPTGGFCFHALGSGEQFCTSACDAQGACPAGFSCKQIPAGANNALVSQCVPTGETCNAGRPLCAACQGDDECGGPFDVCVRNIVSGERFCGRDCNPSKNTCATLGCDPRSLDSAANPDCPTGFSCVNLQLRGAGERGPFQCVPNSNTCRGVCDPAGEHGQTSSCGLGKVCHDGTCTPAIDGRVCSPCSDDDDCRRGGFTENRCISNTCANCPFRGESFCSTACADDAACVRSFGAGFVCKPVTSTTGPARSYCMPQRGTCQTGVHALGEDCSANGAQDCTTGVCLSVGLASFCSSTCTADAQCGDARFRCCETSATGGYDCSADKRTASGPRTGPGVCAPLGGLFGDDCSPGRARCQSGTCLDLGTARVCSSTCSSVAPCPTGFSCRAAQIPGGASTDVCFPSGGGKAGGSCAFGPAACESGLCIRKDSGNICTQACMAIADCPTDWSCEPTTTVTQQSISACIPPALTEG